MPHRSHAVLPAAVLLAFIGSASAGPLKEMTQIPINVGGPLHAFDIGWVDAKANRYYLATGNKFPFEKEPTTATPAIVVIDAKTDKFITAITGVTRPSGVVATDKGELWVGDAPSTVRVIDLKAMKIVDSISTGGEERADEVAYDPRNQVFIVMNPDEKTPYYTLISTKKGHKILAKIDMPEATDGIEQTIWSPQDGLFYTDVPELNKEKTKGGMLVTDPKTAKKVKIMPLDHCKPHGNAVGVGHDLIIGCNFGNSRSKDGEPAQQAIFNTKSGKVRFIPGAGGSDMSAADTRLGQYYTASVGNIDGGPVIAVIDAKTAKLIQKIPTHGIAHSIAVNPNNHHVYVPESNIQDGCGCIRVFAPE